VQRISPDLRNAFRVDESSTDKRLTVILPKEDGAGGYLVPLADGDRISYYLSDASGDPAMTGGILWRALNGQPDRTWSLRKGKGKLDLGNQLLTFDFDPNSKVQSVQLVLGSTQWDGKQRATRSVTTAVFLRNSQYRK